MNRTARTKTSRIMILLIFGVIMCAAAGCSQRQKPNTDTTNAPSPATTASDLPSVQKTDSSQSEEQKKEKYATWHFNKKTKRLTISGTGKMYKESTFDLGAEGLKSGTPSTPSKYVKKVDRVKEIVIKPGVTSIDKGIFSYYTNCEKITIPNTVTKISSYAFYECRSLKKINIPDSVSSIGRECFLGCKSLEKMSLGKNVTKIGDGSFCECYSLKDITVKKGNTCLMIQNGILYDTQRKTACFAFDTSKTVKIKKNTKKIGSFAFMRNPLEKIEIPASVSIISGGAFYGCKNLRDISFAPQAKCKEIKTYGWYFDGYSASYGAFEKCRNLSVIHFPNALRYMHRSVFDNCKALKKMYLGKFFQGDRYNDSKWYYWHYDSLESIDVAKENPYYSSENGILYDKDKKTLVQYPASKRNWSFTIPDGIKQINMCGFNGNRYIHHVTFPASLRVIGDSSFSGCKNLTEISSMENIRKIERRSFYDCSSLKQVTGLDNPNLKKIGEEAFSCCHGLEEIIISGNDTVIDWCAFNGCKSLKKITLKNGVSKLKRFAFDNCKQLRDISVAPSVTKIVGNVFGYYSKAISHGNLTKYKRIAVDGVVIKGKKGSAAQKYAKKNKIKFIET